MKITPILYLSISVVLCVLLFSLYTYYTNAQQHNNIPYYTSRLQSERYLKITPFLLTNQFGKPITQNRVQNKVTVVEFFFSTCKSICPIMNRHLKLLHQHITDSNLHFLSFTVDPDTDTPQQLLRYSQQLGIHDNRWDFVTGTKSKLYALARYSFELDSSAVPDLNEDFIHTQQVVVLDRQGFVRGYFDATDSLSVDSLKQRITKLLQL